MVKKSLLVFLKKNTIMSRKSNYKCKKCGYATDIYEGRGFMGQHIEAMTCPACHNIVPLVVGGVIGDAAPSFNSLVGRLCLHCVPTAYTSGITTHAPVVEARCNPLATPNFGRKKPQSSLSVLFQYHKTSVSNFKICEFFFFLDKKQYFYSQLSKQKQYSTYLLGILIY